MVIHLGTNGTLSDETMTAFFTALSGVPKVVVLTVEAPRDYIAANNAKIVALPAQFPNVSVLYWDGLIAAVPRPAASTTTASTSARPARTTTPPSSSARSRRPDPVATSDRDAERHDPSGEVDAGRLTYAPRA